MPHGFSGTGFRHPAGGALGGGAQEAGVDIPRFLLRRQKGMDESELGAVYPLGTGVRAKSLLAHNALPVAKTVWCYMGLG